MADWMSILANVGSQIAPIIMMLQAICLVLGIYFIASALVEFFGVSNPNSLKYISGRDRFSVAGGFTQLFMGAAFASMSTLEMVGILSRTLTDDYANSRFLSYTAQSASFDEQRLAALSTILGIMQIIGFVAMMKGWMTFNAIAHHKTSTSKGMAFGWMIGGVLAWNFKWATDVINCTLGYNMIGLFSPYGVANACKAVF
jgi:intracellular multiplication protein IcmC